VPRIALHSFCMWLSEHLDGGVGRSRSWWTGTLIQFHIKRYSPETRLFSVKSIQNDRVFCLPEALCLCINSAYECVLCKRARSLSRLAAMASSRGVCRVSQQLP
jgi:hypothetical protein